MSPKEKKEYIKKLIEEGDKRSWNEISADLELHLWTRQYKTEEEIKILKTMKR